MWVTTNPTGWSSWAGLWLKNALNPSERVQVQADGRVYVQAAARGYAVYVLESEYVAYTAPAVKGLFVSNSNQQPAGANSISVFPNPVEGQTNIALTVAEKQVIKVELYSAAGQFVGNAFVGELQAGVNNIP